MMKKLIALCLALLLVSTAAIAESEQQNETGWLLQQVSGQFEMTNDSQTTETEATETETEATETETEATETETEATETADPEPEATEAPVSEETEYIKAGIEWGVNAAVVNKVEEEAKNQQTVISDRLSAMSYQTTKLGKYNADKNYYFCDNALFAVIYEYGFTKNPSGIYGELAADLDARYGAHEAAEDELFYYLDNLASVKRKNVSDISMWKGENEVVFAFVLNKGYLKLAIFDADFSFETEAPVAYIKAGINWGANAETIDMVENSAKYQKSTVSDAVSAMTYQTTKLGKYNADKSYYLENDALFAIMYEYGFAKNPETMYAELTADLDARFGEHEAAEDELFEYLGDLVPASKKTVSDIRKWRSDDKVIFVYIVNKGYLKLAIFDAAKYHA